VPGEVEADREKIEELTAIIESVRQRVRSRYPQPDDAASDTDGERIRIALADLMPIVHARDAAQAKIAAIGSVNPRRGGPLNALIQFVKQTISRAMRWFVRDQVTFNRETIAALEAVLEALNDHNRALVSLAGQTNDHLGYVRKDFARDIEGARRESGDRAQAASDELDAVKSEVRTEITAARNEAVGLKSEAAELKDVRKHWIEWRAQWERNLATNEVQFLRSVADLQGAFQHRVTQIESNFRDIVKTQHADYLGALDRANLDIQKRLWADLEKVRLEYDALIHTELRILRQRATPGVQAAPVLAALMPAQAEPEFDFDYTRFAERFRGSEEYVRRNQEVYAGWFKGKRNVLDIGCGRGELLDVLRSAGVGARGIDLGEESVAQCRSRGLEAERADLFEYLPSQPDGEFDGIVSSQVVEHIAPARLGPMIRLCAAKLRRGAVLAIETPNPECLAIFATHFYLDPTHTRPVPAPLLSFYMEEAGFGGIEIHRLSPAVESMPEVAELPEKFRERFFDGLDYVIVGTKL
jgi:O-antigen chain-terminating methyltransferase